jgi:hypothetical protein
MITTDLLAYMKEYPVQLLLVSVMSSFVWYARKKTSIPGPFQWPIVGNIPNIMSYGNKVHFFFDDLFATYGDIVAFRTNELVITVGDPSEVKESLFQLILQEMEPLSLFLKE